MKENLDDIYNMYYRFLLFLCHDHHVAEDLTLYFLKDHERKANKFYFGKLELSKRILI